MNKFILSLALAALLPTSAMARDVVVESAIGGAVGAAIGGAIGAEIGGRDGAVVGSSIGAAVGVAVNTDGHDKRRYDDRRYDNRHRYDDRRRHDDRRRYDRDRHRSVRIVERHYYSNDRPRYVVIEHYHPGKAKGHKKHWDKHYKRSDDRYWNRR